MNILENQEITFPFTNQENISIYLMKLSDGNVSENLTETLKIEITDKVHNLGNIHFYL